MNQEQQPDEGVCLMQEFALLVSTILVVLYTVIDRWVVTPRYFVLLYIMVSVLILSLSLTL